MDKFEYKIRTIDYFGMVNEIIPDYSSTLNELGKDGWELVGTSIYGASVRGYFKRKLIEKNTKENN